MRSLLVLSNWHDPYRNHALEDVLFHMKSEYGRVLLLYVNGRSIIFGRNQNPFREIDVVTAEQEGIPLIRRISGGGTVYHDLGNLNYSFIEHHSLYDEQAHFKWIQEAVGSLGIQLELTARKDLRAESKKVSGNAFYLKGKKRLHHGTLLINADLGDASRLLMASKPFHTSKFSNQKSVVSVPSPVINLNQLNPSIHMSSVKNAIIDVYYKAHDYAVDVMEGFEFLGKDWDMARSKYESKEWTFGETPNTVEQEVGYVAGKV